MGLRQTRDAVSMRVMSIGLVYLSGSGVSRLHVHPSSQHAAPPEPQGEDHPVVVFLLRIGRVLLRVLRSRTSRRTSMTTPDQIIVHLARTTDQILGRDDLQDRLASGRPLRFFF